MEGELVEKCVVVLEGDEASWRGAKAALAGQGGMTSSVTTSYKTLTISLTLAVSSDRRATRALQEPFNHKCHVLITSRSLPKVGREN